MRPIWFLTAAAGLGLWLTGSRGAELEAGAPKAERPAKKPPASAVQSSERPSKEAACGEYGTTVEFENSPSAAATRAKKEQKLVFVLHVSGQFEESDFT